MKQTIEEYVNHAKQYSPNISTDQLINMVILHFDIPDKIAKQKVEAIINNDKLSKEYWTCWNCSEQNHTDFFNCWKCHQPKQKPNLIITTEV